MSKKQNLRAKRAVSRDEKFRPSTTLVPKIMHVLLNADFIDRTLLARKAKVNYVDMINHLEWLEKKKVIHIMLENGKIMIKINSRWRNLLK